jgi:uncharacterized membrane protein YoaK (UPF0700 family)
VATPHAPVAGAILGPVEIFFTALLALMGVATVWFAVYVVYRLFNDSRG